MKLEPGIYLLYSISRISLRGLVLLTHSNIPSVLVIGITLNVEIRTYMIPFITLNIYSIL